MKGIMLADAGYIREITNGLLIEIYSLTLCRLNEFLKNIYWKILILILGMSGFVI